MLGTQKEHGIEGADSAQVRVEVDPDPQSPSRTPMREVEETHGIEGGDSAHVRVEDDPEAASP